MWLIYLYLLGAKNAWNSGAVQAQKVPLQNSLEENATCGQRPNIFANVKNGVCPKDMIHADKPSRSSGKQRRADLFLPPAQKVGKVAETGGAADDDGKNVQL